MKYKVPFVNYPKQYENLKPELDEAWHRVMSTGQFILRDDVEQLEQRIADYLGVKYCVGLNSGTDALIFGVKAFDLEPYEDEVITASHTFLATVGAVRENNLFVKLVDVTKDYNIDVSKIENAITAYTKAIIPVHLNGRSCQMDKIMKIAKSYRLRVLEDNAQSFGATYNGKKTGSFGDCSILSFYPAKILGTAGDGGMFCTDNRKLADKVRWLRDNGRVRNQKYVEGFGYNSRLDNLHAAILNVKMNHLQEWIDTRQSIADWYIRELKGIEGLQMPLNGEGDVFQNFVIRTKKRDELKQYLADNGIETLVSWEVPMHKQKKLNLGKWNLSETEAISNEVLSLPCYPELSSFELEYVIEKIKEFFK